MASAKLLPLFPLEIVLFPSTTLSLHIFESRYRQMISATLENRSKFGVILGRGSEIADAGCTARIKKVIRRYDDGRFDIEIIGQRRFLPRVLDESLPYLQAGVEYFADEDRNTADPPDFSPVLALAHQVATQIGITIPKIGPNSQYPSFLIASALPLDLPLKQNLLQMRSEAKRLLELSSYLSGLHQRIDKTRRVQRMAGTNGHRKQ